MNAKTKTILDFRIEESEQLFSETAKIFTAMMNPERGGGIHSVAMLDTLRTLLATYQTLASLHYAKEAYDISTGKKTVT